VASVTGNGNHTVSWEVNGVPGGDAVNGTIGANGVYTAPGIIPVPSTVTITARSQADVTKAASVPTAVSLAISPPSTILRIRVGSQQFTATGASGGVAWSVTCVSPCDPNTIGSISPTGLYTAPTTIPDNVLTDPTLEDPSLGLIAFPILVTAAPQSDPTDSASSSVYVNAGGPSVNQAFQGAPVMLGTTGGNVNDASGNFCCSGTLGALVVRAGTNYILSNNHVLARSGSGQNGESICNPGLVDNNCNPGMTVANLSQQVPLHRNGTSIADAAIAQIVSGQVDTTGAVLQLGTVTGGNAQAAPPANTVAVPVNGMLVAKSGRTTGLTCSAISVINALVQVEYENACGSNQTFLVNYDNQVDILSTSFGAPGDSGSLIVDAQTAQPVALLYAGSDMDTVANPLQGLLAALPDSANPPHVPTFVGGATHTVDACVGSGPFSAAFAGSLQRLSDAEVTRASTAKTAHAASLMKIPGVLGVGVGSGTQTGKAALVIFFEKGKTPGPIPSQLDGVPTRVRTVKRFKALSGACPAPNALSARLQSLR